VEGLLGLSGVLVVILLTYQLTLKWPGLRTILWIGAGFRIASALTQFFLFSLPDGNKDASRFQNLSIKLSTLPFATLPKEFVELSRAETFTWFLSFICRVFGQSNLLLQLPGVFIGVLCIILVFKLAYLICGSAALAKQSASIYAVFPSLVLYSAIVLREIYVVFFFLLFSICIVKWVKSNNVVHLGASLLFSLPFYHLHGGLMVGPIVLVIIGAFSCISQIHLGLKANTLLIPQLGFMAVFVILFGYAAFKISTFSVPYLGSLSDLWGSSRILFQTRATYSGLSSYPEWLLPENGLDIVLLVIPRLLYFVGSPFVWDIRALNHLLGLMDGFLVLAMFFFIIRGIAQKKVSRSVSVLLMVSLSLLITYSWGVGNFGTALRHRVKFLPVLIAVASVYTPKFLFKSENPRQVLS